jgi:hypothetical protein
LRLPPPAAGRLLALFFLLSARAGADDVSAARRSFGEGVERFERGDFEGARRLFLQADSEHHAPAILYNLARAEERLGHVQAAVEAYERYLAEAGAQADYAQAAAVAVAELRARSSRVRIESAPAGARVFVDGTPIDEATPTTVLLSAGQHHVVAEGDSWRATADVEASAGKSQTVTLTRPEVARPVAVTAPALPTTPPPQPSPREELRAPGPDGLVFGGAVVVAPTVFFGAASGPTEGKAPAGAQLGLSGEIGYAFAPRAEIVARGIATLGSTCPNVVGAHIVAAGPAVTYRLADVLWIGASVFGGNAGTCRPPLSYDTSIVLSTSLDLALAVSSHPYGQWVFTVSVAYFFANQKNDNPLVYVPLGFGVRFF